MTDRKPSVSRASEPGPGAWRDEDLRRALAAAKQAGLVDYEVEIAPDGTITIVVGAGAGGAWDSA